MSAIECPFCQHRNAADTRFCVACGSSLHLRFCPHCGKINEILASHCEFCGASFAPAKPPDLSPASFSESAPNTLEPRQEPPRDVHYLPLPRQRIPAWPLIAIAVVAGSLPLLWVFRDRLPPPQPWRARPEMLQPLPPSSSSLAARTSTPLPPQSSDTTSSPPACPEQDQQASRCRAAER